MKAQLGAEAERLGALRALGILDTPREPHFDAVCSTARALFGTAVAAVSLVDEDRLWYKARSGTEADDVICVRGFCRDTILSDEVHVVEDARAEPRLRDHALVAGPPGIRFYAGAPLVLRPGIRIGALCIVDAEPRSFSLGERRQLRDLADIVVAHLRLHEANLLLEGEIAARLESEAARAATTALLTMTLDTMDQGLMMIDAAGVVRVCNARAIELLELPAAFMRDQPSFQDVLGFQQGRNEFRISDEAFQQWVTNGGLEPRAHSYERERPNGTGLEIRTVLLADGSAVRTYTDVTERKRVERRIAHMARHDALTDLPNRTLFRERLEQKLAEVERYGGWCAVLCLDLDRFKFVNDTLGHLAGDALLREVSNRLKAVVRSEDTVARLGGDEFAILLGGTPDSGTTQDLAARLIAAVQLPVMLGEQQAVVGLSIGIAFAAARDLDGEEVFKHADLALYRAKADGRSRCRFFEPAMDDAAAERRELELDLRRAVVSGDLALHYQPQVRSEGRELIGFEALARWKHPTRGFVPPSTFIALAEETGLIGSLGEWVLRTACREAAKWTRPLKVAVNLSAWQFQQANLPEIVLGILTETGLPPGRLELEITETVIINDMARALSVLRRLRGLGIRIAMDDFGTGYSSLATLQAFPFDKIKIDRSFVGKVGSNSQAAVIVRAVLSLGRSLNISVVAEGVETPEQMRFLVEEACPEVQGYLFGKPQPIEQFAADVYGDDIVKDAACAA